MSESRVYLVTSKTVNERGQNSMILLLMLLMILNFDVILKLILTFTLSLPFYFTIRIFFLVDLSFHWHFLSSFIILFIFSVIKKNDLYAPTRNLCTFYLILILYRALNNQNNYQYICTFISHMLSIRSVLFFILIVAWYTYTYHCQCSSFFFVLSFLWCFIDTNNNK